MSKDVLISIRPRWVEKICHRIGKKNGKPIYEKKIEVRKTKPAIPTPFKCYIYCTKGKTELPIERKINREVEDLCDGYEILYFANGKVIGEFTCDKIDDFYCASVPYKKENNLGYGRFVDNGVYKVNGWHEGIVFERNDRYIDTMLNNNDLKEMCLSVQEVFDYIGIGKHLYGWHISDLKIYDKPKELIEFCKPFNPNMDIHEFFKHIGGGFPAPDFKSKYDFCDKITRPPQSWCYVEEL